MTKPDLNSIPAELKARRQWVLSRRKIPTQPSGVPAKSNDPTTWTTFDEVVAAYSRGGFDGIGYIFAEDDPFCGIDLDGCRHPREGIADWAQDIISRLDSYAEVSPSGSGVKIFVCGKSPFSGGKKKSLPQHGSEGGKEAGIEVYDHGRFFVVTGQRVPGPSPNIEARDLDWLQAEFWPEVAKQPATKPAVPWATQPAAPAPLPTVSAPASGDVLERARLYLSECDRAVQGQGGHDKLLWAAAAMVHGFLLSDEQAFDLLAREYNPHCLPPWDLSIPKDERDFRRKISEARRKPPQFQAGWLIHDPAYAPIDTTTIVDVQSLIAGSQAVQVSIDTLPAGKHPAKSTAGRSGDKQLAESKQLPDKFRWPTGFLGLYVSHCMEAAHYPNFPLALAGGLALLSAITGRKIVGPSGLPTNIYVLGLALPGSGKNFPRTLNAKILEISGGIDLLAERMASAEGIEDRLTEWPVVLFQPDEVDSLISAMESGRDGRSQAIASALNQIYTSSNGVYVPRVKAVSADSGSRAKAIIRPHVALFGTATPRLYYEAVGRRLLEGGFVARTAVFEADQRSKGRCQSAKPVPERLIEETRYWLKFVPPGSGDIAAVSPRLVTEPLTIPVTSAGQKALAACQALADEHYAATERTADAGAAAVWSRVYEQTEKLATLYAVSENHLSPQIDEPMVDWAGGVVTWSAKRSLALAAEYCADSPFQEGCKCFFRTVVALGGRASRRDIMRKLKEPVKTVSEYAAALAEQGRIVIRAAPTAGGTRVEYEAVPEGVLAVP